MTSPRPDDQRLTGHWLDEDAVMDTLIVRFPRWRFVRLFGRNPLVRASDRVEAWVLVLAMVVALVAVPIAAAVGTAVHDSRRQVYGEQAQTRHAVTATVIDDSATRIWPSETMTVRARWFAAGAEHTGTAEVLPTARIGDSIEVWVDNDGSQVSSPTPTRAAAGEAMAAALVTWLGVATAAAASVAGTRAVLNRARRAEWQHDFDNLVGGDRHTGQS